MAWATTGSGNVARRLRVVRHNPRMPQRDVGLILMRQLASGLAVPTLIADEAGEWLFFNEPAERLLGQRFDEVGAIGTEEGSRALHVRDEQGNELPTEQNPLIVAMRELRPVHRRVRIRGLDGQDRALEVTTYPLVGPGGHLIGGVAMFWERKQ
jgi:PAS domain-containing protein